MIRNIITIATFCFIACGSSQSSTRSEPVAVEPAAPAPVAEAAAEKVAAPAEVAAAPPAEPIDPLETSIPVKEDFEEEASSISAENLEAELKALDDEIRADS